MRTLLIFKNLKIWLSYVPNNKNDRPYQSNPYKKYGLDFGLFIIQFEFELEIFKSKYISLK